MRKTELLKIIDKQKKQIEGQCKTIEDQCKTIENTMEILKVLVEGGEVSVHIHKDKENYYFVNSKDGKKSDAVFSKKIYEGLYSRGLLVVAGENVHEDFAVQRYALRVPKEK